MDVGTISLVGISVVFFTFVVLFFLFKLLAIVFGDKKKDQMVSADASSPLKQDTSPIAKNVSEENDTELLAVISAAITAYTSEEARIIAVRERPSVQNLGWKNQRVKIWRPLRKGVKRVW
ncbi:MAG TPA: OadG family protein [Thermotogota bacterium]|nr:OadG family protein [Thermotogota bacterium]HRW33780.1 OadG family protein [Thermotogota bacterium]